MSDALAAAAVPSDCCARGLRGRSALVQPAGRAEAVRVPLQWGLHSGMALKQFDFGKCTFGDCACLTIANWRAPSFRERGPGKRSVQPDCDLQKARFPRGHRLRIDPSDNQMKGARFSFRM